MKAAQNMPRHIFVNISTSFLCVYDSISIFSIIDLVGQMGNVIYIL